MGLAIAAGGVVGALTGALLTAYWWDFPPEDLIDYSHPGGPRSDKGLLVAFYSALGVVGGLVIVGFLIAVVSAYGEVRGRRTA